MEKIPPNLSEAMLGTTVKAEPPKRSFWFVLFWLVCLWRGARACLVLVFDVLFLSDALTIDTLLVAIREVGLAASCLLVATTSSWAELRHLTLAKKVTIGIGLGLAALSELLRML